MCRAFVLSLISIVTLNPFFAFSLDLCDLHAWPIIKKWGADETKYRAYCQSLNLDSHKENDEDSGLNRKKQSKEKLSEQQLRGPCRAKRLRLKRWTVQCESHQWKGFFVVVDEAAWNVLMDPYDWPKFQLKVKRIGEYGSKPVVELLDYTRLKRNHQ